MCKINPAENLKRRVVHYWSLRAEDFEKQREREFESEKKRRWLAELEKYLPQQRQLRVLDIGTGTGFFACLLAEKGHEAVGIDLTPDMIQHAKHMAALLNVNACFEVMDAERPEFAPESFDVLITRNVTWTLPHLGTAYQEWYKLLKPDGVFINFDADYCSPEELVRETELPENHTHKLVPDFLIKENNEITLELSAFQDSRPQWDVVLLEKAGFSRILVDREVYKQIYREIDEFYNPVPIFAIAAYK